MDDFLSCDLNPLECFCCRRELTSRAHSRSDASPLNVKVPTPPPAPANRMFFMRWLSFLPLLQMRPQGSSGRSTCVRASSLSWTSCLLLCVLDCLRRSVAMSLCPSFFLLLLTQNREICTASVSHIQIKCWNHHCTHGDNVTAMSQSTVKKLPT